MKLDFFVDKKIILKYNIKNIILCDYNMTIAPNFNNILYNWNCY